MRWLHSSKKSLAVVIVALLTITLVHSQTSRNADLDRIRGEISKLRSRLGVRSIRGRQARWSSGRVARSGHALPV